jgi:hypothetical protein
MEEYEMSRAGRMHLLNMTHMDNLDIEDIILLI